MSLPRRPLPRLLALLVAATLLVPAIAAAPAAAAARPRPSLTGLYNEFMCVACHESLAVAQSPESFSERQYIRDLIAKGESAAQIKQAMIAAYGPAVLAVPPASGFNLVVYVLPAVLVGLGVITLVILLPKWRRRTRADGEAAPSAPALPTADARRLEEDLSRYA